VGLRLATLLDYLAKTTNLDLSDVHIVGFSLGAHVAGATGRAVKRGVVGRITGLDPAQVTFFFDWITWITLPVKIHIEDKRALRLYTLGLLMK
jgi:hypothetical protein